MDFEDVAVKMNKEGQASKERNANEVEKKKKEAW